MNFFSVSSNIIVIFIILLFSNTTFAGVCDNLSPQQCSDLGFEYQNKGDYNSALQIYNFACSKNFFDACYNLGIIEELLGNKKESRKYYKLACDNDVDWGCIKLVEDKKDIDKILFYHKRACSKGNQISCASVEFKNKNFDKATEILEIECNKNDKFACETLTKFQNIIYEIRENKKDKNNEVNKYFVYILGINLAFVLILGVILLFVKVIRKKNIK